MRSIILLILVSVASYAIDSENGPQSTRDLTREGINLQKTLKSGFSANHWDIREFRINYEHNLMFVKVDLYKNKASKQAGKSPVKSKDYRFLIPTTISRASVFTLLKALDEFSGATDD